MDHEFLVEEITKKLKKGELGFKIKSYLKNEGISTEVADKLIEQAKGIVREEKLSYLPKRNKFLYVLFCLLTAAVVHVFMFVLPEANISQVALTSLLGTFLFCVFAFYLVIYYKSWEKAFVKAQMSTNSGINYSLTVLFLIPSVVVFFIFFWRLESGEDAVLKDTQVEVQGTVLSSNTFTFRGIEFTDVKVEFYTKEGKKVVATEQVAKHDLKNLKNGQEVFMIYSSGNPQNVDLLLHDSDLKKFKNSAERPVKLKDLIQFLTTSDTAIGERLNQITYGWKLDEAKKVWVNKAKGYSFSKSDSAVSLVTRELVVHTYLRQFKAFNFVHTNPDNKHVLIASEKIYVSPQYTASITSKNRNSRIIYTVRVEKN